MLTEQQIQEEIDKNVDYVRVFFLNTQQDKICHWRTIVFLTWDNWVETCIDGMITIEYFQNWVLPEILENLFG